jgi:hypothetical protein
MAKAKPQPAKLQPKLVVTPKPVVQPAPKPVVTPKPVQPAQSQQFFTYKPGTGGSKLVLKPGQTLGYAPGKGYYAKPAAVAKPVAPPTVSDEGGYEETDWANWDTGQGWNPGPNYGADLVGAPDFTEANAAYEENVRLSHDQRRNRIRAALIKLGFQPGGVNAKALEGIDPSTAELAANNSASALAKLGLKRGTDRADLSADLASRGLLDSGALRGGENMVQSAYDMGLLGATQEYLNEQDVALSDEAQALATGQNVYTAAKAAAANAAAQNPLFTPTWQAGPQQYTLAPGQGTRPEQTPVLAKPPPLVKPQPKPPPKVVPKVVVKPKPKVVPKVVVKPKPKVGIYSKKPLY